MFRFKKIALLFFLVVISNLLDAQEDIDNDNYISANRFSITYEGHAGYALGNNFVAKGTNLGIGFGFSLNAPVYDGFYIITSFDQLRYKVNEVQYVGAIDRIRKRNYSVGLGYILDLSKNYYLGLELSYVDAVNRNFQSNEQGNGNFKDSGEGARLTLNTGYKINKFMYAVGFLNYDYMFYETVTAPSQQGFVDQSTFLTLGLGLRITIPYNLGM